MSRFDLQSHLNDVYAHYPEADKRPVIGITGNYEDLTCKLGRGYYQSVVEAGGVPVVIPPVADKHVIINTLEHVDALILSGGADINPLWVGEEPSTKLHGINQERDLPELLIARLAYNRQIPMLGICRGIQTLAAAFGGKVSQDISDVATVKHSQDADRSEPTHSVIIDDDSVLRGVYGCDKIMVFDGSFGYMNVSKSMAEHLLRCAPAAIEEADALMPKWLKQRGIDPECL